MTVFNDISACVCVCINESGGRVGVGDVGCWLYCTFRVFVEPDSTFLLLMIMCGVIRKSKDGTGLGLLVVWGWG